MCGMNKPRLLFDPSSGSKTLMKYVAVPICGRPEFDHQLLGTSIPSSLSGII